MWRLALPTPSSLCVYVCVCARCVAPHSASATATHPKVFDVDYPLPCNSPDLSSLPPPLLLPLCCASAGRSILPQHLCCTLPAEKYVHLRTAGVPSISVHTQNTHTRHTQLKTQNTHIRHGVFPLRVPSLVVRP
eukprot:GGOE01040154.1.p2 GENE.GGOE01040154.1~~GGOE01040154.1.p2  ORF type:complete len:134 (-),score=2.62 GGOE01040154.1:1-402(-)